MHDMFCLHCSIVSSLDALGQHMRSFRVSWSIWSIFLFHFHGYPYLRADISPCDSIRVLQGGTDLEVLDCPVLCTGPQAFHKDAPFVSRPVDKCCKHVYSTIRECSQLLPESSWEYTPFGISDASQDSGIPTIIQHPNQIPNFAFLMAPRWVWVHWM